MTTSHAANLKKPDRFLSSVTAAFQSFARSGRGVLIGLGVLLAIGAAISFWGDRQAAKSNQANGSLYEARTVYEREMKALADSELGPTTNTDAKKGAAPNAEARAAKEAALQFAKWDVDAKLPKTMAAYAAVIAQYPGTRAAFDAQLAIADLYSNHGDAAKALAGYERAQSAAKDGLSRALVYSSIGYAHENAGKCDLAVKAWESALNQGEAGLKADLQMSLARCSEKLGDAAKARTYYDQVIADDANSESAKTAELYKSLLTPPANAPAAGKP